MASVAVLDGEGTMAVARVAGATRLEQLQLRLVRTRPALVRGLRRARLVCTLVGLVLLAVASVIDLAFLKVAVHVVLMVVTVLIALALTPTRSLSIPSALHWLAISACCAPFIAIVTIATSALAGVGVTYDGAVIVIAGVVEEIGKLVPLAVLACVSAGAMRSRNRTDWLVLGYLSGAGFSVVEEGLRLLYRNVGEGLGVAFARLDGLDDPRFTVNPLALASIAEGAGGHAVWTSLVAGAFVLAARLTARRPDHRRRHALLPIAALVVGIADHASSNGALSGDGLFSIASPEGVMVSLTRILLLDGWLVVVALVALWCWALASDALDRGRRAAAGVSPASRAAIARALGAGERRVVRGGIVAVVLLARDDLRRVMLAVRRLPRRREGVALLPLALTLGSAGRMAGMSPIVTHPRRAVVAMAWTLPIGLVVAIFGGAAIGWTLASVDDGGLPWSWLAGMFDALSSWWNGLTWYGKALVISLIALGLLAAFPTLSSAGVLQILGWGTSVATYGGPLVAVLRDPSLIASYLLHTPPREIAIDLAVLLLNAPFPVTRGQLTRDIFDTLFAGNPRLWQETGAELYDLAMLYGDDWLAEQLVNELGIEPSSSISDEFGKLTNPYLAALEHSAGTTG